MKLKASLKKVIPPNYWQVMSRLRRGPLAAAVPLEIMRLLSDSTVAQIKSNLTITGKLDYRDKEILMNVDSGTQLRRLNACAKEPETVAWIETNVKCGDVFFDVGANVGAYSFVANAVTGGGATIYSFEPSFSTFSALCQNIFLNKCEGKITSLNMALGEETGLARLSYGSPVAGAAGHALGFGVGDSSSADDRVTYSQPVLCYRLDDLIREFKLPCPNHLKIDVDGGELSVLLGAEQTLANPAVRSILIEVEEQNSGAIQGILCGKGFVIAGGRRHSADLANHIFVRSYSDQQAESILRKEYR